MMPEARSMESAIKLRHRLSALSTCTFAQDVRSRATMVSVALDVASPSRQFLSDLYDVCVYSVTPLKNNIAALAKSAHGDSLPVTTSPDGCDGASADSQLRATCAAAALHYLPQQGADGRIMQQFLVDFFLPVLAHSGALPDKTCRLQACTGLVAVLVSSGLWQQLRHLTSDCCRSLDAAAGAGTRAPGIVTGGADTAGADGNLPLPMAFTVLTAVVQQLRQVATGAEPAEAAAACTEELRWLLPQMRAAVRPLLSSASASVRQGALKALVPITLASAQACGGSDLRATAQEVWQVALDLLGGATTGSAAGGSGGPGAGAGPSSPAPGGTAPVGTVAQRTALALLVLASDIFADHAAGVDVAGCERFWEMLRTCLALPADVDSLERKRAMLLLQRLAPAGQMEQPGWALWAALYDILDEFPIHLVAPMWAKIDQLHAPAPEFRTDAVVPKSYIPRKKEVKQRKAAAAADAGDAAAAEAAAAAGEGPVPVPQPWQCVLWARVLQHGNVQVQRLGMRTFLQRDWRSAEALRGVSPGFVTGVLLPALARDIHYRGGGAEAEVLDVQALAAAWLQAWFAAADVGQRMEVLLAVRDVALGGELTRLGLQQLMRGAAAAARSAAADGQLQRALAAAAAPVRAGAGEATLAEAAAEAAGGAVITAAAFPAVLLAGLRAVLVSLTNYQGVSYKRSVWRSALVTAAAAAPAAVAGVTGCLRLLAELPPASLEPGGELRALARSWLVGRPISDDDADFAAPLSRSEAAAVGSWLREMMDEYWGQGQGQASLSAPAAAAAAGSAASGAAAAIVQLVLLFDDVEAAYGAVLKRLQQALYGMYGRPYLQASEVDRALVLLRELLAVLTRPLGGAGAAASADWNATAGGYGDGRGGAGPSALAASVVDLLVTCCEDVCSAASHSADAFLEAHPPVAAGGLDRAEAAWACVSRGLMLTCRTAPSAGGVSNGGTAPTTRRLATALQALLGRLCQAPLPAARHAAVVTGMRAATAAAEALRNTAALSPDVRTLVAQRLDASALAAAALRDAAAVAAAAAAADASVDAKDASQALSDVEAAKWPLLDAATALAAPGVTAPVTLAAGSGGGGGGGGGGGVRRGSCSGGGGAAAAAVAGGLQLSVVSEVLSQAVAALSEYPEGQVLPLLRCLRRCWVAVALGTPELQAVAARALGADVAAAPETGRCSETGAAPATASAAAALPLESLCWPVVRALWNALCATPRRTGPLCAAFVNTALLPSLFVQQSGAQLVSLHGPGGPCRWLLSRLLEWGGTSSRFLLLLACQLGSFLTLQPALVECYSREIQLILLWGSRKGATYDPEGPATDGTEGEELAAVAAPGDPDLVSGASLGTDVAPRVALLCCIHRLAENAGTVWPPPAPPAGGGGGAADSLAGIEAAAAPAPPAPRHASSSGSGGSGGGGGVAGDGGQQQAVSRRPVIVFGDASFCDFEKPAASGASAAAASSHCASHSGSRTAAAAAAGGGGGDGTAAAAAKHDAGQDNDAADLDAAYGAPSPRDQADPSLLAGRLLWRQLLAVALHDPLLSTDKVRNGSELHRQKVRLWQSLVVLSSFVAREECGPAVAGMLAQVNGNNPPTVKQYIEAVVAALVLREPSLLESQVLPLLSNYSRHLTGLGSYILIAAQVLLHSPPAMQRRQLRPLLLALCPWLMCHGHNVRTYAQLVMWALLSRFPPEAPMWAHSIGDLAYLRQMLGFMQTNADLVRLRRNIGDPILEWSPAAMASPSRVFASAPEGVCLAGSPIEQSTFEGAPSTLVDRIHGFLIAERHRLRDELSDRAVEREYAPQDPSKAASGTAAAAAAAATTAGLGGGRGGGGDDGVGDFQRKIRPEAMMATLTLQAPGAAAAAAAVAAGGAAAAAAQGSGGAAVGADGEEYGLAALLDDEEDETQNWKSASGSRQHLRHDVLLVASLIDKLPNLAGLARTCEVLGAGRLVLADLAVTRESVFTSVSVTAEQWLPMEEVKPAALLAWLERRAAEGYTLVGLEQTAESVRLPDYRWPGKVVLVLGREKEGIPPEVLSLLDATLEIPQRGIIRSLNVHVSGAIALYEYVRQMQVPRMT